MGGVQTDYKVDVTPKGDYSEVLMDKLVKANPQVYEEQPNLLTLHKSKMVRRHSPEELIEIMYACKGNMSAAARLLNVHRVTLHRWITDDKSLDIIRHIDEEWNDRAEEVLNEHIDGGDLDAAKFRLETKAKSRGYTKKVEVDTSIVIEVKVEE